MICHHILWRYTEAAEAYGKQALVVELNRRFQSLIGQIPGLLCFTGRCKIGCYTVKISTDTHDCSV